ncbi:MAG: peptidyl-tRNA hydrolase Pth2 [Thermoplasmataceae archaeon]
MVSEVKMVIAYRKDIDLGKGKMAAQVAHAAVSCALQAEKHDKKRFKEWTRFGQKKVVIRVNDLDTIYMLKERADKLGITNSIIIDAGLTQVPPGTVTCLGIGPFESDRLDEITGEFPLL